VVDGVRGTERPPVRWFHAASDLADFMITTFRVAPERLARYLPPGWEPEVLPLAEGPAALVSAVAFRDEAFHFRGLPRVAITCGQVNYRAYVRRDGVRGAWFLGTAFDHATVALPRHLLHAMRQAGEGSQAMCNFIRRQAAMPGCSAGKSRILCIVLTAQRADAGEVAEDFGFFHRLVAGLGHDLLSTGEIAPLHLAGRRDRNNNRLFAISPTTTNRE